MSLLFSPRKLGPLVLKNRSIRSAAFEGMSKRHIVNEELIEYHRSVAAGDVAMTTIAYASVSKDGLSFPHQLLLNKDVKPGLTKLIDTIHAEGAAVSIQIGHTGNMSKKSVSGYRAISPSGRFNLYGPTWPRRMSELDIQRVVNDFAKAAVLVKSCGIDAVEIHAGHGYLISQFLSPYTNRRKDSYGGSYENRSRFLREVLQSVRKAIGINKAIVVKMNMRDGFDSGYTFEEAKNTARLIESEGADAIVLSGGFVSSSPLYIMRGRIPSNIMAQQLDNPVAKYMVKWFGDKLMKPFPFKEGYFLEDALEIRKVVDLPLIAVGGMNSRQIIEKTLSSGFEFVAIARALIEDPGFIRNLHSEKYNRSACDTCNYCVAVINKGKMRCHLHIDDAIC